MALSVIALYYLPTRLSKGNYRLTLCLVGLACLIRLTAALFWFFPMILSLRWVSWKDRLIVTPIIVIATIGVGVAVDSLFYGKFTVSWWNFYVWNIPKGVSEHYGRESAFYHLRTSLPLMINTQIGYFVVGVWRAGKRRFVGWVGVWFLVLSSCILKHKETRFLTPLYPIIVMYCGYGAQQIRVLTLKKHRFVGWVLMAGMIGSQVVIGWFYGRVHFNGAYEIIDKLRNRVKSGSSVYLLVENHVVPGEGYLHCPGVKFDFLKSHSRLVDELMPSKESLSRDRFQSDPLKFIEEDVIGMGYEQVMIYAGDLGRFDKNLRAAGYFECERAGNSLVPLGSNKSRGDLLIYCKD